MNSSRLGLAVLGAAVLGSVGAPPGLSRAVSDTVTTSDSLATQGVYARSVEDTTSVSDGVAGRRPSGFTGRLGLVESQMGRIVLGSPAEGPPPVSREVSDTVTTSESAERLVAAARGAEDTTTVSDDAAAAGTFTRTADDTIPTSDTLNHSTGVGGEFNRAATDTETTSDALGALVAAQRAADDTTVASDAIASPQALTRGVADSVTGTDTLARTIARKRTLTDTRTGSQTIVRRIARLRTPSESIPIGIDSTGIFNRTVTDSVPIGADSVQVTVVNLVSGLPVGDPPPPWDPTNGPPPPPGYPAGTHPAVAGLADSRAISGKVWARGGSSAAPLSLARAAPRVFGAVLESPSDPASPTMPDVRAITGVTAELPSGATDHFDRDLLGDAAWSLPIEFEMRFKINMAFTNRACHINLYSESTEYATNGSWWSVAVGNSVGGAYADRMRITDLWGGDQDYETVERALQVTPLTPADNVWMRLKVEIGQTTMKAKLWKDADPEPGVWSVVTTGGGFGDNYNLTAPNYQYIQVLHEFSNNAGTEALIDWIRFNSGYFLTSLDEGSRVVTGGWGNALNGHAWVNWEPTVGDVVEVQGSNLRYVGNVESGSGIDLSMILDLDSRHNGGWGEGPLGLWTPPTPEPVPPAGTFVEGGAGVLDVTLDWPFPEDPEQGVHLGRLPRTVEYRWRHTPYEGNMTLNVYFSTLWGVNSVGFDLWVAGVIGIYPDDGEFGGFMNDGWGGAGDGIGATLADASFGLPYLSGWEGRWFRTKLEFDDVGCRQKIWPDDESEPSAWQYDYLWASNGRPTSIEYMVFEQLEYGRFELDWVTVDGEFVNHITGTVILPSSE